MNPERIVQLFLVAAGFSLITLGETYIDAIGVTLLIYANNFDYVKEN